VNDSQDGRRLPERRPKDDEGRMPLVEHLRELRSRLIKACLAVTLGTGIGYAFRNRIINALSDPVCRLQGVHGIGQPTPACPNGLLYLSGVLAPLTFAFTVSLVTGIVLSSPMWSYHLWAFLAPGLYKNEKRYGLGFAAIGVPLFCAGAGLCLWVFPRALKILIGFTPSSFSNGFQGEQYLTLLLRMIIVFGLSFEVPLLLVLLNLLGMLSAARMIHHWRGIVFGIFVFAAIATPTGDPLTMTVLAVPLCLLFVAAVGAATLHDRRRATRHPGDPGTQRGLGETPPLDLSPSHVELFEEVP
jgi:sec-independent protein translocase protein TatC